MLLSVGLIGVAAVMAVGLVKTDDRRRTTDGD
jgi:hypothetical protein